MILPAVLIAAVLCAGILLGGLHPATAALWLSLGAAAICAGFLFLRRERLCFAGTASLLAWVFLGAGAVTLETGALPAEHASRLSTREGFPADTALRWRGRLRSNPVALGWGARMEIDLDEVERAGRAVEVSGGLRLLWHGDDGNRRQLPALLAGDRVEALVRARAPRNFLNPGAIDVRGSLARHGIHLTAALRDPALLRKLSTPPLDFRHWTARIRGRLLARLDELFAATPQRAAVLRGMLLGDYSFIDHQAVTDFQKTGVYHVLIISGMHMVAVAAFVYWLGRLLGIPAPARALLTVFVLGCFVAIVEDSPPVTRAAVMTVLVLVARVLFRRVDLLQSVAVAAVLMLLASPSALFDPSFQLSFLAATLIGALVMPALRGSSSPYRMGLAHLSDSTRDTGLPPRAIQLRLDLREAAAQLAGRLPAALVPLAGWMVAAPVSVALAMWEVFLTSTIIQIGMLPVLAHTFHRVSLAGPLANIPAVALSGLMVPLGLVTLIFDSISRWLGMALAAGLGLLTSALVDCVAWFSRWQGGDHRIPGPPLWLIFVFFATLAALCAAARLRLPAPLRRALMAVVAVQAWAVAVFPFAPRFEPEKLSLTVLDVGQGDSLFVVAPDCRTMLIDGGGQFPGARVSGFRPAVDIGERVVSPFLWHSGIRRLDVVALTHAHLDHMDGLFSVLQNFHVGELWVGRDVHSPAYRELVARAAARGIRVVHHLRGHSFQWGEMTGVVLWPEDSTQAAQPSNNDSLVMRLEFGRHSMMLPGDIEEVVESELVTREVPLPSAVLKVAHHGSKSSTGEGFLRSARPAVAVVSVAENNPFGHPHPDVVGRLERAGVRILRTDRHGAVRFTSDGRTLRVSLPRN